MNILKSTGAILSGLIVIFALSHATDFALEKKGVMLLPFNHNPFWFMVFVTIYRLVYVVFGSYIAAALAPKRPILHAMVLASIGFVLGTLGAIVMWDQGPHWYPIALIILGWPSAWLGGMLQVSLAPVRIERIFPANVEKVWELWNDAESMKQWWSPKDYTAPVIQNDFRINGTFLLSMKSPQGEMFWNTGKYIEIITHKKIVSTMSFADEKGNPIPGSKVKVPGKWPDTISVTVEFKEDNGKTKVIVTEVGIPGVMKLFAKMGWEQQFDKFETLLLE